MYKKLLDQIVIEPILQIEIPTEKLIVNCIFNYFIFNSSIESEGFQSVIE